MLLEFLQNTSWKMNGYFNNSLVLEEIKIYQWLYSLFVLNFPPLLFGRSQKGLKYYSVFILYLLYTLLLLLSVIYAAHQHNFIVKRATLEHQLDSLTEIATYMQNIGMAVMQMIISYKTWFCYKELLEILLRIKNLEGVINKLCPDFIRSRKLRQTLFLSNGLFLILLISFLVYLNFYLIAGNMDILDKCLVVFFLMSVQIKFVEYGLYVQVIYVFLKLLLKILKNLKEQVENDRDRNLPLPGHYQKTLRQNQQLLLEIWYLVYRLENYFGWPILMLIIFNGNIILCTVSWAYVQYVYSSDSMYQICK